MFHCGADVHSKSSHLTIVDSKGKQAWSGSVPTTREGLREALEPYRKHGVRVIQETGSLQAFIQEVCAEIGVEAVTVHAAHMRIITASKKKTDKRDSFQLAWRSFKDDLPEPVYVPTPQERDLRTLLCARERAMKGRLQLSNGVRGQLKSLGILLAPGQLSRATGWEKLLERDLPGALALIVRVSHAMWLAHGDALGAIEQEIGRRTAQDELIQRLQAIPYLGPVTSAAVRAHLGDLKRFRGRKAVASYAGFAPTQRDSGDRSKRGGITREGPSRLRALFVQAAHLLIGSGFKKHAHWKGWYERLLHRKGHRHIAVVAVAKRLYLLAYHVGKSGGAYLPPPPPPRERPV